ncbi:hypothetical protein QFC19_008579 [Naganishia cerealis]|uniref:Uncharacterized protein n=1 Tax=Naganishia cerealis TaxID=610337 RepID=A0ACC2V157_9TREE|nr:hypothetical protein QFC19_008579 [Naganishia cerealis]
MNKQAGHTGHPLRPTGEPASVPSSLTYVPPSTGSQQLQWALVPVWRSEADAQTQTSQLAAPRPGFAASRMSQRMPSLSFPQLNSSGVYQPVSAYHQENSGNPQSTTGLLRFAPNSSQFQEADVKATSVKNYDPNQMHGMIGTAYPSSAIQQFFRPAEGQNAGQEPSHPDSTLYFPEFNGFSQQSSYPLKASSTGTSFSSQDYTNVAPMQTCGSSVGSPPYTPLPTSTVSSYTSAGEMCRQQQDQIKQVYPPTMFMQTLPETPALASPIQERFRPNIMPVETGMVGLGIMMPGM